MISRGINPFISINSKKDEKTEKVYEEGELHQQDQESRINNISSFDNNYEITEASRAPIDSSSTPQIIQRVILGRIGMELMRLIALIRRGSDLARITEVVDLILNVINENLGVLKYAMMFNVTGAMCIYYGTKGIGRTKNPNVSSVVEKHQKSARSNSSYGSSSSSGGSVLGFRRRRFLPPPRRFMRGRSGHPIRAPFCIRCKKFHHGRCQNQ